MGALLSRALFEAQQLFADAVRLWHSHPHNPFAAPQVAVSKPPAAVATAAVAVAGARAVVGARAAASPAPVRSGPRQRPRPRPGAELAVALDRDAAMLHATLDALR